MPTTVIPHTSTAISAAIPTVTPSSAAEIISFASTSYEVAPGEDYMLTWETKGGETSLCYSFLEQLTCDPVPASGSRQQIGSADATAESYTLVVRSNDDEARAGITVTIPCPYTWHTSWNVADPAAYHNCPSTPYVTSQGAIQRFEHGIMIWIEATQEIFVFSDHVRAGFRFLRVNDRWESQMPEGDPELVPPPGRYQPVRGFGLVWREEILDGRPLSEELGWAIEPEAGFQTAYQCTRVQTKWGTYENCYILGESNVYETMAPYGDWQGWPR